jgi:hypothetical protein
MVGVSIVLVAEDSAVHRLLTAWCMCVETLKTTNAGKLSAPRAGAMPMYYRTLKKPKALEWEHPQT